MHGPRRPQASKLDPFKPYLEERMRAGVWNASVLLRELRERSYPGGYTILTSWLRPQRTSAANRGARRFETPPGKQAQVDSLRLGYLPLDDLGTTIFFQLISGRYERGRIFMSSNRSYGEWRPIFRRLDHRHGDTGPDAASLKTINIL